MLVVIWMFPVGHTFQEMEAIDVGDSQRTPAFGDGKAPARPVNDHTNEAYLGDIFNSILIIPTQWQIGIQRYPLSETQAV